jgi:hypothetical protein
VKGTPNTRQYPRRGCVQCRALADLLAARGLTFPAVEQAITGAIPEPERGLARAAATLGKHR